MIVVHSPIATIVVGFLLVGICDVGAGAKVAGEAVATAFIGSIAAATVLLHGLSGPLLLLLWLGLHGDVDHRRR